ncbi:MAG: DUF2597 family protein [Gammaproteobacteria bacterium]|nr:DUF2597 family protein [Gammaproteobacteria bacterium]
MGQKLSGRDIDVMLGDLMIHFEDISLDIDDATAVSKTKGVPNGFTVGEVGASGELVVDTANFNLIMKAAEAAGSFQQLGTFDTVFNGDTSSEKLKIEAFDCKFKISGLIAAKASGGEKLTHKLPYDVTGSDFVRINGVPYVNPEIAEKFI